VIRATQVMTDPSALSRFWGRVRCGGPDDCWEWLGHKQSGGYGRAAILGQQMAVHRISKAIADGAEIPAGMVVDHLCCNRSCVNPAHLRVTTITENTLAPHSKSVTAIHAAKTHCIRGHPYDEVNTRVYPLPIYKGVMSRVCRKCHQIHKKNSRHRLKASSLPTDKGAK